MTYYEPYDHVDPDTFQEDMARSPKEITIQRFQSHLDPETYRTIDRYPEVRMVEWHGRGILGGFLAQPGWLRRNWSVLPMRLNTLQLSPNQELELAKDMRDFLKPKPIYSICDHPPLIPATKCPIWSWFYGTNVWKWH